MTSDEKFCYFNLDSPDKTLIAFFNSLYMTGCFVDCALAAADGRCINGHTMVLSACSPFLKRLFSQYKQKYPILILKDVTYSELKQIVHYMYYGKVCVTKKKKKSFLSAGNLLQIEGLSGKAKTTMNKKFNRHEKQPWKSSLITPSSPPRKTVKSKHISFQVDNHSDCLVSSTTSPPNSRKRRCTVQRKTSKFNLPFHSNEVTHSFESGESHGDESYQIGAIMTSDEKFWYINLDSPDKTLIAFFNSLYTTGCFVDCALAAADGRCINAHTMVLSACSPYLKRWLSQYKQKYPILMLKDVTYNELKQIVHYMYYGKVFITKEKYKAFLSVGNLLQIKGLSGNTKTTMNEKFNLHEKQPRKASPITQSLPPQKAVKPKHISSQVGNHSDCSVFSTTSSPNIGKRRCTAQRSVFSTTSPPNISKRRCTAQRKTSEFNLSLHSYDVTHSFDTLNKFQSAPSVAKIVPNVSIASPGNVTMPSPIVPEVTIPGSSVPSLPIYSSFNDLGTSNFVVPDIKAELISGSMTEYSEVNNDGGIVDFSLDDYNDFDKLLGGPIVPNVPLALPIVPEVTFPGPTVPSPPLYSSFNDLGTSNFVVPDIKAELISGSLTEYSEVNNDGGIVDFSLDDYNDFDKLLGGPIVPNVPLALPIVPEVTFPGPTVPSPPLYSSFNDLGTSNFVVPDIKAELISGSMTEYSEVNNDGGIVDFSLDDYKDFDKLLGGPIVPNVPLALPIVPEVTFPGPTVPSPPLYSFFNDLVTSNFVLPDIKFELETDSKPEYIDINDYGSIVDLTLDNDYHDFNKSLAGPSHGDQSYQIAEVKASDEKFYFFNRVNPNKTLIAFFNSLYMTGCLVDCALAAAEGNCINAHKTVLSASSPYLELIKNDHIYLVTTETSLQGYTKSVSGVLQTVNEALIELQNTRLLSKFNQKYPVLILKDVTYNELKQIVHYMYYGKVTITKENLEAFLSAGNLLQIKGLSGNGKTTMNEILNQHAKQPWKASPMTLSSPPRKTVEPKQNLSQVGNHSDCSVSGTNSSPNSGKQRCSAQRKTSEINLSFHSNDDIHSFDTLNKLQSAPSVANIVPNASIASPDNVTLPLPIVPNVLWAIPMVPEVSIPRSSAPSLPICSSFNDLDTLNFLLQYIKAELVNDSKPEYIDINDNLNIEVLTLDDEYNDFDKSLAGPSHGDKSHQSYGYKQI